MKAKRCKKGKQFVALLLALIMVSGLTAYAAGGETSSDAPGDGKSTTSVTESTDTGESDGPSEGTDTGSAGDGQQNSDDTSKGGTGSADGDVSSEDSDTRTEENGETADTVFEDSTSEEKSEEAGDTEEVSVFDVNELAEDTVISSDETKGIAQLENLIPDINFRTEVWRSLSVAGQLGDPEDPQYEGLEGDELYQAVLGNFTGHVYASGYEKEILYKFSFQYWDPEYSEWTTYDSGYRFTTYEEALKRMQREIERKESDGLEVNQESAVIMSQITVTEKRKPDKQLIKDITGVEYLRKAEQIDFTDNKITSLLPLDRKPIADEFCNGNIEEVRRWFGEPSRNTIFTFVGNPLTDFPAYMPGRIDIDPPFSRVPVSFEKKPVIIVKDPDEGLPLGITVDMPEIRLNGQPIQFHAPDLDWTQTLTEGRFEAVYVPDDSGRNTGDRTGGIISATGISHSGEVTFSIGTMGTDMQKTQVFWDSATVGTDSLAAASCGITVAVQQQVRVVYEVIPGEPGGTVEISFNKYELGTKEAVAGAKYHLFEMEMDGEDPVYSEEDEVTIREDGCAVNQDGKVIARPINEEGIKSEYITGENGGFTCNADLGAGTYCFIETESPEGYELNTDPVMFTVETSDTVQISGGDRLTRVELSRIAEETYQLYERETSDDSGTWNLYNNDDELSFSPDEEGVIEIEGLEDGSYQLRPLLTSSEGNNIEFKVTGGAVTGISEGITAKAESASYIDRYSDPISITLPQPAKDQQLDSLTIEWYKADNSGVEQRSFKVGERIEVGDTIYEKATAEEVRKATQEFINLNKGTADEVGSIQGQVTITPVYKYKPSKPLKAEDPAKVQFSFVKTEGDPSDTGNKGLAGAEFTLYYADEDWGWSENAQGVYKTARAAEENEVVGVVSFGDLDSGNYIMKETDAPDGYSALPGYWKITANAWAAESDQKLIFKYVRKAGTETAVSEDDLIPEDIYGNNYYIPNYPVEDLPSMGGGGTRIFTVFGLLFTGTAIILFVCARRNKKLKGV